MRRAHRQNKIYILNRKCRSNTEKRWNSDRCLYFLYVLFKWILKYLWSCRTTAFGLWLAWITFSVILLKGCRKLCYLITWETGSKGFPSSALLVYPHNQFLVPRTFVSPFSWCPSHNCFPLCSYCLNSLPLSLKQNQSVLANNLQPLFFSLQNHTLHSSWVMVTHLQENFFECHSV